jgi:hypothetical protein
LLESSMSTSTPEVRWVVIRQNDRDD